MSKMKSGSTRRFGVDLVGDIEWGTHLCQFYQTKKDLVDILVPYFAEGLRNNEFCMWVTSSPLEVAEARRELRKAVPDLDEYVEKGQIEILSYENWYLLDGEFDADRVLQGWVDKEKNALERGFEGLRLTGNTFWVERSNWRSFANYETMINDVIGLHRMIALCTYSLRKCTGNDVVDVMRNHAGTLIRKGKAWNLVEDIAERKKVEEEIRNIARFPSENPHPVLRIGGDGTVLYSNPAGLPFLNERKCGMGGLAPDNWRTLVADSLRLDARKEFDENYGQSIFSFLIVPVSASGYVNVYGRDITERKRAEQALEESQRDLNRAQAVAQTGSWRLNVRRNELLWSDETYRLFGIPKGTPMTYEAFLAAIHPDDRESVDHKWKAALNGESYDIEHRIIVDGKVEWVREKAELEFNKDGTLLGGFGTVQNITERKQIQDKLFQSERKYRTLYETSIDGIVSTNMNGRITECNDAFANMLGYSKDELKTITYQQLTPEKWHQMEEEIVREHIIKRGYSDLYEKEYIRKDGSIFPVSIRVWLVRDEKWSPAGMWGIIRDITQSKQLEDELKRHSEHLERLVEERTLKLKDAQRLAAIGETAAMVGHDIRNPLQTVEGAVYIAKEEIRSLPSRTQEINNVEEMLNTIHEETRYVDKIVTDLQDYARPLTPELEETDIQQLFNKILADSPVLPNIEVSMKVEQDCCKIVVDPTMMKRILTNLITNALQAMPSGGKLTIAASKQQDEIRISVQDTGQGIPEENRAKIFQPLFSTKAKGQGLGLAVVKRLVEAHSGLISFDSEFGKGTTFTVSIPIAKEAS